MGVTFCPCLIYVGVRVRRRLFNFVLGERGDKVEIAGVLSRASEPDSFSCRRIDVAGGLIGEEHLRCHQRIRLVRGFRRNRGTVDTGRHHVFEVCCPAARHVEGAGEVRTHRRVESPLQEKRSPTAIPNLRRGQGAGGLSGFASSPSPSELWERPKTALLSKRVYKFHFTQ